MRVADDAFRVVTGAFDGPRDEHWFRTHLPDDGSVTFVDNTTAFARSACGARTPARSMESIVTGDISDAALPYGSTKEVLIDSITVRLFRISYVGEHGWEVYVPSDNALAIWDRLWEAGQAFGVTAVGAGVYGTTGRLEKGYRLMGAELDGEYTPVEAGLARPKVKSADFIGKEAYLARARSRARGGAVHAHRRGPHLAARRHRALHDRLRADPHARRRAHRRREGPAVGGHVGRRGPVGRQVPPARVPPARSTRSSAPSCACAT